MSCIRFNTPAQRKQMAAMAPVMDTTRDAIAVHPSPAVTDSKITRLRILATSPNPKIRESVGSSYHAPVDIFVALAADPDEGVRSCIARNEAVPGDVLASLVSDSSERVRGFLALNFFVPAETIAELAHDPSETVRGLVQWKMAVSAS